ncbi:MAG: ester cyclase [Acidimicrobiales bacterium]
MNADIGSFHPLDVDRLATITHASPASCRDSLGQVILERSTTYARQGAVMSNVRDLTATLISLIDAKDLDGLRAIGLDKVSFTTPDFDGSSGSDFTDYLGKWTSGFPDYALEAGPIIAEGNRSAFSWIFRGTQSGPLKTDAGDLPPTGKKVEVALLGTAVWEGEQLKEFTAVWDQLALMQQLGLV